MPKSSKKQINEDEKKFLKILQTSSGVSIENIAKRCGFSRQKVSRIKKRLEKDKTIWGYNAVVDVEKLGLKNYLILIKKTNKPIEKTVHKIVSRELDEKADEIGIVIHSSHYLHGEFDWQICFVSENIVKAKKFCEFLNITYHPSIKELKLLEILFPVKSCGIQNPNLEELKDFL